MEFTSLPKEMQEKLRAQALAKAKKEEQKSQKQAPKEEEESGPAKSSEPEPEDLEEEMAEEDQTGSGPLSEKDQKLYDKMVGEKVEKGSPKGRILDSLKKLKSLIPDEVMRPIQRYMLKRELKQFDSDQTSQEEAVARDLQAMKDRLAEGMSDALDKEGIDTEKADLETIKSFFQEAKIRKEFAEAFVEDAPPEVAKVAPPSFLKFMVMHILESMTEWAGKPEGYESAMDKKKRHEEYSKEFDSTKASAQEAEAALQAAEKDLAELGERPALGSQPDKKGDPEAYNRWLQQKEAQREWDSQAHQVAEKKKSLNEKMRKLIELNEDYKAGPEKKEELQKRRKEEEEEQAKSKKERDLPYENVKKLLEDIEGKSKKEKAKAKKKEKEKAKDKGEGEKGKQKPKPKKPKSEAKPETLVEDKGKAEEAPLGGAPAAEGPGEEAPAAPEVPEEQKPTPAEEEAQRRERQRQKERARRVVKKYDLGQDDVDAIRKFKIDLETEEEEAPAPEAPTKGKGEKGKGTGKGEKSKGEKAEKAEKPKPKEKPKTDAQKMREFMQGADPEMRKRMEKMTPKEFMQMLVAISEEEEAPKSIRLARYLESDWIRWAQEDEESDEEPSEKSSGLDEFLSEITEGLKAPSDEVLADTFEAMVEDADNQKKAHLEDVWFRLGSPMTAEHYFFDNPERREVRQFARSKALDNTTPREKAKGAPPTMTDIDEHHPGSEAVSTLSRYIVDTEEPVRKDVPQGREELPKHPRLSSHSRSRRTR